MPDDRDTPDWTRPDEHAESYDPHDPIPEWEVRWMVHEIETLVRFFDDFLMLFR